MRAALRAANAPTNYSSVLSNTELAFAKVKNSKISRIPACHDSEILCPDTEIYRYGFPSMSTKRSHRCPRRGPKTPRSLADLAISRTEVSNFEHRAPGGAHRYGAVGVETLVASKGGFLENLRLHYWLDPLNHEFFGFFPILHLIKFLTILLFFFNRA